MKPGWWWGPSKVHNSQLLIVAMVNTFNRRLEFNLYEIVVRKLTIPFIVIQNHSLIHIISYSGYDKDDHQVNLLLFALYSIRFHSGLVYNTHHWLHDLTTINLFIHHLKYHAWSGLQLKLIIKEMIGENRDSAKD